MTTRPEGRGTPDLPAGAADEHAYRRDAERWLAAYPPRWRRRREEEVLGVLLDTRPPGADRLDRRTRWDLLRGAATYRWRSRPPFTPWLAWRVFEVPLPERYRAWGRDDADGRWLWLRELLAPPTPYAAALLVVVGLWGSMVGDVLMALLVVLKFLTRSAARDRRRKLLSWPEPPVRGFRHRSRRRVGAGRWLWWPVASTGVGLLAGAAAVVVASRRAGPGPADGAAWSVPPEQLADTVSGDVLLTGLLLVVILCPQYAAPFVHPRRRLVARPAQPHREQLVAPPTWLLAGACVLLALAPLAASGVWLAAVLDPPWAALLLEAAAAPVGLLMLLAALYVAAAAATLRLVAARAERRHPGPPVALRDVLDLGGWDQLPVDQPEAAPAGPWRTDFLPYPPAPGAHPTRPTSG